jgi:hypothetical protein
MQKAERDGRFRVVMVGVAREKTSWRSAPIPGAGTRRLGDDKYHDKGLQERGDHAARLIAQEPLPGSDAWLQAGAAWGVVLRWVAPGPWLLAPGGIQRRGLRPAQRLTAAGRHLPGPRHVLPLAL